MIMHVLQTAYVTRTGRGAPWQLAPVDLLTGAPTWFYPSGAHLLAAATAGLTGGAVVPALNAQTVVLLAAAGCTGAAALGAVAARQLGLGRGSAMLVAGVASLVMAGLYRPAPVLMHDGGIFANAVALSLVPAAVAGVLALGRLPVLAGVGVGASVAGVVWCHPSAAVSIAVTTGAWWAGMLVAARGRHELRRAVRGVAVAAGVAAVLLVPAVAPGLGQSARTANWPPDTGARPVLPSAGRDPRLSVLRRDRPGADPRPDLGAAARARRDRRRRRAASRGRAGRGIRGVERDRRRRLAQPGDGRRRPGHAVLLSRDAAHLVARLPARTGAGGARRGAGREPGGGARPPPSRLDGPRTHRRRVRRLRGRAGRRVRPDRRTLGRDPLPRARVRPDRSRRRRGDRLAGRARPAGGAGLQLPERRLDLPLRRARRPGRQHLHPRPDRGPLHVPAAGVLQHLPVGPGRPPRARRPRRAVGLRRHRHAHDRLGRLARGLGGPRRFPAGPGSAEPRRPAGAHRGVPLGVGDGVRAGPRRRRPAGGGR